MNLKLSRINVDERQIRQKQDEDQAKENQTDEDWVKKGG